MGLISLTDLRHIASNLQVYTNEVDLRDLVCVRSIKTGIPIVYSGSRSIVLKAYNQKTKQYVALKLFHQEYAELKQRLRKIERFTQLYKSEYIIPIYWYPSSITYHNNKVPACISQWIGDINVHQYISLRDRKSVDLLSLAEQVANLSKELNNLKIAHGDLKFENMIMKDDKFVLIDYEDMFIPDTQFTTAFSTGTASFQHPSRTKYDFFSHLDNFSLIVIYLTLISLHHHSELVEKFKKQGRLFSESDFENPLSSDMLSFIISKGHLQKQIEQFITICANDFYSVPTLATFIQRT